MSRANWRAPGAYEELRSLDAPGFAWEYLRRNPEFQRDRARLEAAALLMAQMQDLHIPFYKILHCACLLRVSWQFSSFPVLAPYLDQ